jgi:Ca-activated chloride channel family protein
VFGASVASVFVDVFVSRDGEPVTGLSASHFELREDGVARRVELVSAEALPLTTILVLDTSGSVSGPKLVALKDAGAAFLEAVPAAAAVALVTFSHEIRVAASGARDRAAVALTLSLALSGGSSAVMDALYAGIQLAGHERALVVLFSDGQDNMSWLSPREVKAVAERSNAVVHVVGSVSPADLGLGPGAAGIDPTSSAFWSTGGQHPAPPEPDHLRALREIAEATGGRFWGAGSPARLRQAFAKVAQVVNARYVLRYEASVSPRPGWHELSVKLRGARGRVSARRGYFVAPPR